MPCDCTPARPLVKLGLYWHDPTSVFSVGPYGGNSKEAVIMFRSGESRIVSLPPDEVATIVNRGL